MDSARQIIRWSIPGWLFLFALAVAEVINAIFWGFSVGDVIATPSAKALSPAIVLLLIASGIPVGFIIYQAYYAYFGATVILNTVTLDRGGEILQCFDEDTLTQLGKVGIEYRPTTHMSERKRTLPFVRPVRKLLREFRNPEGRRTYAERAQANWYGVRSFVDIICLVSGQDEIKKEYTAISDIYHALGASRVGLALAGLTYAVYNYGAIRHEWPGSTLSTVAATGVVVVLFLGMFHLLGVNRDRTLLTAQATLKHGMLWYAALNRDKLGLSNESELGSVSGAGVDVLSKD